LESIYYDFEIGNSCDLYRFDVAYGVWSWIVRSSKPISKQPSGVKFDKFT